MVVSKQDRSTLLFWWLPELTWNWNGNQLKHTLFDTYRPSRCIQCKHICIYIKNSFYHVNTLAPESACKSNTDRHCKNDSKKHVVHRYTQKKYTKNKTKNNLLSHKKAWSLFFDCSHLFAFSCCCVCACAMVCVCACTCIHECGGLELLALSWIIATTCKLTANCLTRVKSWCLSVLFQYPCWPDSLGLHLCPKCLNSWSARHI